jgi:hypothetical protein
VPFVNIIAARFIVNVFVTRRAQPPGDDPDRDLPRMPADRARGAEQSERPDLSADIDDAVGECRSATGDDAGLPSARRTGQQT